MELILLGSGQDAGIPHTGCFCNICTTARKNVNSQRLGPSIALYDKMKGDCYLIDASPDFKPQLEILMRIVKNVKPSGRTPLSGIFLTHAHLGHIGGLWQLGWEALAERNLPVYCTPKMAKMLKSNYPYSLLVKRKNIIIHKIKAGLVFKLDRLKIKSFEVPHRNEIGDTVGYVIEDKKRVVYLPDLDRWSDTALNEVHKSDIAFIDGTFCFKNEYAKFTRVPHPPIQESIELLNAAKTEIYFTHINHTNPVNINGQERSFVESKGFKIAYDGLKLEI
jgi:pyrroloquinoline quinone biosynthesis protein B